MAKKKVGMSISEMDAKEKLYGNRLTASRAAAKIVGYLMAVLVFTYVLYGPHHIWWIVGWMVVTAIYVYRRLLPRQVESNYERRSENERNRFVNYMTQGMTTQNANVINVMRDSAKKLEGEFKHDLESLIAVMMSAQSFEESHAAFQKIQNKYSSDVYFVLFMEQIETVYHENIYHIETFNTFKDSHNTVLQKEKEFIQKKSQIQTQLFVMMGVSLVTNVVTLFSSGYDKYLSIYADTIGGIVIGTLYMLTLGIIVNSFYKKYYDDDVLHFGS